MAGPAGAGPIERLHHLAYVTADTAATVRQLEKPELKAVAGHAARAELSALMRHWFPALVAKNHADMKWKKFLYKQLCEREEVFICKAPSCAVCSDQPVCFGPETG